MPVCLKCNEKQCACCFQAGLQPYSALDILVEIALNGLCVEKPVAKRRCMASAESLKIVFPLWKRRVIAFINQQNHLHRKKLPYTQYANENKHALHFFRNELSACQDYQSAKRLIELSKIHLSDLYSKLLTAVCEEFFAEQGSDESKSKIKFEYIRENEILCVSNIIEAPNLVSDLISTCKKNAIPIRLFQTHDKSNVWIRDRYIAFSISPENRPVGHYADLYLKWSGDISESADIRWKSLFSNRKYSYVSSTTPEDNGCLPLGYQVKTCPIYDFLDKNKEALQPKMLLQGGNVMVVQRCTDASRVVLVGENSIAQEIYSNNPDGIFPQNILYQPKNFEGDVHCGSPSPYLMERRAFKTKLYKRFGLSGNDTLAILPDADFHLDCFLFTPCPGVVVVNDLNLVMTQEFHDFSIKALPKEYATAIMKFRKTDKARIDEILNMVCKKLMRKGLRVLRAPLALPSFDYDINAQRIGISAVFNLANSLIVETKEGYQVFLGKTFFPKFEDYLTKILKPYNIKTVFLGDPRENQDLLLNGGLLHCITNVLTRECFNEKERVR